MNSDGYTPFGCSGRTSRFTSDMRPSLEYRLKCVRPTSPYAPLRTITTVVRLAPDSAGGLSPSFWFSCANSYVLVGVEEQLQLAGPKCATIEHTEKGSHTPIPVSGDIPMHSNEVGSMSWRTKLFLLLLLATGLSLGFRMPRRRRNPASLPTNFRSWTHVRSM